MVETTISHSSDGQGVHDETSNVGASSKALGGLPIEIRLLSMIRIFLFSDLLHRIILLDPDLMTSVQSVFARQTSAKISSCLISISSSTDHEANKCQTSLEFLYSQRLHDQSQCMGV